MAHYHHVLPLACYLFILALGCAPDLVAPAAKSGLNCMFYGYPDLEYDGLDRTDGLTEKSFNKTVFAKGEKSVVFFNDDMDANDPDYDQYECFLQLSAQIMKERGYDFYTVNTKKDGRLAKQEEVDPGEDSVNVYQNGHKVEYNGVRDPDVFVSWLMDIPDEVVTVIDSDDDVDDFEELADESVRVVGYFEPNSKRWKEFEEAAEEFMGEVEFYTASGSMARKLGLQRPNEVIMYRPYESEPLWAPTDSDTEAEFEDWVEDNKEPIMEKMTQWNYFDVWRDTDEEHHMIIAFVDEETDEGEAVLDILKEIVEENTEYSGTLKIVLIDPDEHAIMVDTWEETFDIDIEHSPQIGLVDISEKDSMWFDMDQLNLDDAEEHVDENEEVLQRWIEQILEGEIDIDSDDTEPDEPEVKPKKKKSK